MSPNVPASDLQTPDTPDQDADATEAPSPLSTGLAMLREIVLVLVIALGLSLIIKTFLVQAFYIPSESMENTLLVGDRVLVSKLTPGPFDLKRGDIVVFADSGHWLPPALPKHENPIQHGLKSGLTFVGLLPQDSNEHLIKRVIGLPGDKVVCCDANHRLTVNGHPLDEPYIYPGALPSADEFSITVPPGRLWVMGDNRGDSSDSRVPGHGPIPISDVVGKAFVRVWPADRFGLLRNPAATFKGAS